MPNKPDAPTATRPLHPLEAQTGIIFADQRLLRQALVHRSYANERPEQLDGLGSNERLEFLGDSLLNYISAVWLYQRFPERGEGELTSLRAALVRTRTLALFASQLRLGEYVLISLGEGSSQARARPALLADLFEALVGAIFLDQGLERAQGFVLAFFEAVIGDILAGRIAVDYRSLLQHAVQAQNGITPSYRTVAEEGPEHQRTFTVEVLCGDAVMGRGSGSSKQKAAYAAAHAALIARGDLSE